MLDELSTRVILENNIRLDIRENTDKRANVIKALQSVLEYDDFTIWCITDSIKRQEQKEREKTLEIEKMKDDETRPFYANEWL